jgi:hypothetical protein
MRAPATAAPSAVQRPSDLSSEHDTSCESGAHATAVTMSASMYTTPHNTTQDKKRVSEGVRE